jgi:dTDP-4-amino-4,6-dideoxygalactose transaminase
MTDIAAALGLAQLERYDDLLRRRRELIELYDSQLRPFGTETIEHFGEGFASSGHLYMARIPGVHESQRNEIIARMADAGVATNVHYKPLPVFSAYRYLGYDIKNYPNAFRQYQNQITLPLHTRLSNEDVGYVTESLKRAIDKSV